MLRCDRKFAFVSLALLGAVLSWNLSLGDSLAASTAAADEFISIVASNFPDWDRDHDGELSVAELDTLVADFHITGQQAAAVAALKRASRSTKYKLPPLTLTNLRLMTRSPAADQPDLGRKFAEGGQRLANVGSRDLFASGLPRLETIHQGKLGNCFALAPIAAMVYRDPRQVAALFVRQDDGRYRVTLGTHRVCVALPTDAELAMTSSNEREGIWVNLYEKALGEARNATKPPAGRPGSPMDALARGGSAGAMLALITGHDITRFSFKFAKDPAVSAAGREARLLELRQLLRAATEEKRLMTCGTLKTTTPGVTPNHAYAVLNYQEKTDMVTLWNPHGGGFSPKGPSGLASGYPQKDGILCVPLSDWVQQFSGMAFEVLTRSES